ncbi:unnamed protein product [Adineta ricciae]|uniref:PDZ domain-containing protein n=1 Tax=Adineta ricciae TaxID=249248 RepID=A0A815DIV7_ADIRI|nr:unnamed protein product [Adineta ricciae]CAF1298514.1 unnamed protein product [Adineta ricciae]
MTDKNKFANIQRLNSTIMAKCEWTSSLIGMRKTGEEIHHRRTKTHRKANEFLQELFNQRSDGDTFDDNGVTDRYHRFLRTKSNLGDDGYVLDEFDRRLRALNNNRLSRNFKSTDEGLNAIHTQVKHSIGEEDFDDYMKSRRWTLSKSTLDNNALSSMPSHTSQMNVRSNVADRQSSSDESTTMTSGPLSTVAKTVHESMPRPIDSIEKTKERHISSLQRDATQADVQQDAGQQMGDSTVLSSQRSLIKHPQKPNIQRLDSSEDAEDFTSSVLHSAIASGHVHQESNQMRPSSSHPSNFPGETNRNKATLQHENSAEETSTPSSSRRTSITMQKSAIRHDVDVEHTEHSTIKISACSNDVSDKHVHASSVLSANPSHDSQTHQLNANQSVKEPSTSTSSLKRSIRKPSNIRKANDTGHVQKSPKNVLPKPQVTQLETKHDSSQTSHASSSALPVTQTLYKPVARRVDGSEAISTTAVDPLKNARSVDSLFNRRFFPRSLVSNESAIQNSTRQTRSSSPPMKQYDNAQLYNLLDRIENQCTPVDFTLMLDRLPLSFGQAAEQGHNGSAENDNRDTYDSDDDDEISMNGDNIATLPDLFDESSASSQDYYTTFVVNIDNPKNISLYKMTISSVQLSLSRTVPYSILVGRRPLLERSKETNFKRFRSRQHRHTYQVIAIESSTGTDCIQTNDIILKINEQSIWNFNIDSVKNTLRQSNTCSLTIARLCQPFI